MGVNRFIAFILAWLVILGFVQGVYAQSKPSKEKIVTKNDTIKKDTSYPYNFHLYLVLRKKHYHALLTVKDTTDKILLTQNFDSLRVGRNFFNIPTKKKLPAIVYWELKAGDLNKKGKMAIH